MAAIARPLFRPVRLASYGTEAGERQVQPTESSVSPLPGIRSAFPRAGVEREGGTSDGYRFRIQFRAGKLAQTYALLLAFLREHGYGDVPVPASVEELRAFRLPPRLRHQLSLFGEDGYVHNPLKILFPPPGGKRGALWLELYDETADGHLLKFHRRER